MEEAMLFALGTAMNAYNAMRKAPTWMKAAAAAGALWALREAYLSATEKSVRGEICLITGAGSGIGRLLALKMAQNGAKVALLDINEEAVKEAAGEVTAAGGEAVAVRCDVTSHDDVRAAVAAARAGLGGDVTILVNNAGVVSGKPLTEISDRAIELTFAVNAIGHFWTLKECLPSMITTNHGHIVTVASAAGWAGLPGMTDYCASKWAACGLAEALRSELRHRGATGVKTTLVCPYFISTGMFEGVQASWLTPLLPILRPDDVVAAMIRAVKRDEPLLNMPWPMVGLTPLFRGLLPVWLFDAVTEWTGVAESMDTFAGRSVDT